MDILQSIRDLEANGGDVPEFLSALSIQYYERYSESSEVADIDMAIELGKAGIRKAGDSHPSLVRIKSNLAVMHIQRFGQTGQSGDLDAAVALARQVLEITPAEDPAYAGRVTNFTGIIARRCRITGNLESLDEAIELGKRAALSPLVEVSDPSVQVNNLGNILSCRYQARGNIEDLNEAIAMSRKAVDLISSDHRDRGCRFNNVGAYLALRYERLREIDDLHDAIEMGKLAVETTPPDHPDYANQVSNQGSMIALRYERTRNMDDLDEAVKMTQRATGLVSADSVAMAQCLNNLWRVQGFQYQRTGQISYLNETIDLARHAVDLTLQDNLKRPAYLDNLGSNLLSRYEVTGELYDLEEAIKASRQALEATVDGHPDLPDRIDNMATKLARRYERLGDAADIERAIELAKDALESISRIHPKWSDWSSNLGNKYCLRYLQSNKIGDLEDSISQIREAVESSSDKLPNHHIYLNNLAHKLILRYTHSGRRNRADLDEAVELDTKAINLAPRDSINLAVYLNNLGDCFRHRYLKSQDPKDLKRASDLLQDAWGCVNAIPFQRVKAGAGCLKLLALQGQIGRAVKLGKEIVEFLPMVKAPLLDRGDLQFVISTFSGVVADLCAVLLSGANDNGTGDSGTTTTECLRYLEQGRTVIINQLMDRYGDVSELEKMDAKICRRYLDLLGEVNAPMQLTGQDLADLEAMSRRRAALDDLRSCIEDIRDIKGHERFLLGLTESDVQECAAEGAIVVVNITDFRSDAIIVSRDSIEAVFLPKLSALDAANWSDRVDDDGRCAETFRPWSFCNRSMSRNPEIVEEDSSDAEFSKFLSRLWSDCVSPVLTKLGLYKASRGDSLPRIWWMGIGAASSLPFHAAGHDSADSSENTFSWVISSYIPSIKALYRAREKARMRAKGIESLLVVTMPTTPGLSNLPAVQAEWEAIQRIHPQMISVKLLDRPNKITLLENIKNFDIAHFACHGSADVADPSHSFLALQGDSSSAPEKLTVKEMLDADLGRAWLAYLSACSTAQNKVRNLADEDLHMSNSFLVAGFTHVLASLWPSNDSICAQVAEIFYHQLFKEELLVDRNKAVAAALHAAVSEIRLKHVCEPRLWAQYIHSGI